jgi:uncharacterized membrane protein YebE (DUF533 family)
MPDQRIQNEFSRRQFKPYVSSSRLAGTSTMGRVGAAVAILGLGYYAYKSYVVPRSRPVHDIQNLATQAESTAAKGLRQIQTAADSIRADILNAKQ